MFQYESEPPESKLLVTNKDVKMDTKFNEHTPRNPCSKREGMETVKEVNREFK